MASSGGVGPPQRISGSGVHPQHDLLLVNHHNAVGSCNVCNGPFAGLPSYYSCGYCMFNVHVACIFEPSHPVVGPNVQLQPQPQHVVGPSFQQQPQHAVAGPDDQALPNTILPPRPPRGLKALIAGTAITTVITSVVGGAVSEIIHSIMRDDDDDDLDHHVIKPLRRSGHRCRYACFLMYLVQLM
ncbi:unnamed protein product [Urochloa decumbens]|uniref:DC1 domain-containing protein n=1 Tax=Urochloa decumbens TaxID=240449 RepID=A0ABC9AMH4_9POAL